MEIQDLDLALILVIVLAFLILVQTVILLVAFSKLSKMLVTLEQATSSYADQLRVLTRQINAFLPPTSLGERLPALRSELKNYLQAGVEATKRADESIGRALAVSRARVEQANDTIDTVLSRFSQQTFLVHRAVLHPAMHASAFLHGVFTGVRRLISGGPESPASHLPGSEDFV
jgi:uncharacterized membrane protein (Fun14 family)